MFGAYLGGVQLLYADKVLPGVEAAAVPLGGKTAAEAAETLAERTSQLQEVTFAYQGRTYPVRADQIGLRFDAQETARAAARAGDQDLLHPLRMALGSTTRVGLRFRVDEAALRARLQAIADPLTERPHDAAVVREGGSFRISRERAGTDLDLASTVLATKAALAGGQATVVLGIRPTQPALSVADVVPARAYAELISSRPLTVTAGGQSFRVETDRLTDWVTFVAGPEKKTPVLMPDNIVEQVSEVFPLAFEQPVLSRVGRAPRATLDPVKVAAYLTEIGEAVDSPPVNARLGVTNGAVTVVRAGTAGQGIDRGQAGKLITEAVRNPDRRANLPIVTKPADIRPETLPQLGLTGLIGQSTTTFAGSPVNRTFNIGVGASKFDGVLIKPGEEFSFNKSLGDVGPETGYRQELVILERTTEKQYGGGLCQVSTTAFRAALGAGLPITARTNHSYAVRYYAPIGMDATIYPPNPDLRFKNNTPGHIYIQTATVGESVTFQFFGTPDGRKSSTEILYINATESAGGTAAFRYVVEGGPDPINRVFSSSYKPQGAFPISDSLN